MPASANNEQIRRALARRAGQGRAQDDEPMQPFTVVGVYDPEHPDYDITGWRKLVYGRDADSAQAEAIFAAAGNDPAATSDDEWISRMEATQAVAVIAGHHPTTLCDPVTGRFDRLLP